MPRRVVRLSCVRIAALLAVPWVAATLTAQQQTKKPPQKGAPATEAMRIDLDELETNPEKYLGKTVTVEGEVDRVLDGERVAQATRSPSKKTLAT